jgi:hypothetical protein
MSLANAVDVAAAVAAEGGGGGGAVGLSTSRTISALGVGASIPSLSATRVSLTFGAPTGTVTAAVVQLENAATSAPLGVVYCDDGFQGPNLPTSVFMDAELIRRLPPIDMQVIVLWLEGETASAIAEITGLSAGAVNVRVHRIKALLASHFEFPETGETP